MSEEYEPEYLCIKFSSGETIMGELVEETENEISLGGVMSVSLVQVLGSGNLVASPYCKFTEGGVFSFNKNHILFVKRLHPKIIANYLKLAERMELAYLPVENDSELMSDDDLEMNDYLDALEKLIKPKEDFEPSTEESIGKKSFVRGNETKH
jgi:hypothetical protein